MPRNSLAFVDLETTGANPQHDRITEVGIVTVADGRVSHWSSLINPGRSIPEYIQQLTGIDNRMVADAPRFEQLADEIAQRLRSHTFIAHNARFDYGFLKAEYQRLGRRFQADVLCTVKLSRQLFPQQQRHNLDSIVARHGLRVDGNRHRALADAELLWQFWQRLQAEQPADRLESAIRQQLARPSLPPQLDPAILDDLPETPGVYLFHGEDDALLYIGKSINLRQRILSHFRADTREFKAFRLSQQVRRIDWQETAGELGALLLESRLIKQRQPIHNRRLRRTNELCSWGLVEHAPAHLRPELHCGDRLDLTDPFGRFGLFRTRREAVNTLRQIAEAHELCLAALGLEKTTAAGRPCFAYQLQRCRGACVGEEPIARHSARLLAALERLKLSNWPYPGAIGIVERDRYHERLDIHVVDNWCHLGTVHDESDLYDLLEQVPPPSFDRDTYKLLLKHLQGRVELVKLPRLAPGGAGNV